MNTLETMTKSKSHRQYDTTPVTQEQMEVLMNCGLCAPSSKGEEPWYLVGLLNKRHVDQLDADIQALHQDKKAHFYNAPCAILVCVNESATTPVVDAATCTQNILLAAEDLNLASCWIDGVLAINDSDKFNEYAKAYSIPAGYKFQTAVALGHRLETPSPKVIDASGKTIIVK